MLDEVLTAAESLGSAGAEHAARSERDRTLAPEVAEALAASPIPSMLIPAALGGGERHPGDMVAGLERIARDDASTAWCAMVAATSGLVSAYIDPGFARESFGPPAVGGGVYAPMGRATLEGDAYVVSGRWPFASGCRHATTLMGGALIAGEEEGPSVRAMVFPAAEVEIHDTWETTGLRATGSHDIEVADLRVPAGHTASLSGDRPRHDGPLYAFPAFGLLALGIAGVAMGIARGAIDDLVDLAASKKPGGSKRTLAERSGVQATVARAEALAGSARSFVDEAIAEAWDAAASHGNLGTETRAKLRLAATHATRSSAEAVSLIYDAGGGTAIYARSPLERRFRDVHTAKAHMMVSPASLELVGRTRLGLETDTAQL
jgi:alkylation response protein AidB-like acyl-CoA dehydrogenase